MGRRKTEFEESARDNALAIRQYIDRLSELSMSMFEWKNLPETVDERYLELTLFTKGSAIFFEDKDIGYLALQCISQGEFDIYGEPTKRRAYSSYNHYNKYLNKKDSVIIWNNSLRTNSMLVVRNYAKKLWDIDRTIEINAKAQKTPILLQTNEKGRLTLLNAYKEYDGNAEVIYADKNFDLDGLKVFKTDAPYVADKLYDLKTQIWNEALTYLGISNNNIQKKERMIRDEVVRNTGGIIANRYSRLNARQLACEKINAMFGTDIECVYRADYRESDDEVMFDYATGDENMKDMVIDLRTK